MESAETPRRRGESPSPDATEDLEAVKYPKPLVLLADVDSEVSDCLRTAGYDVTTGTFGRIFPVDNEDRYYPVPVDGNMPQHYTEREVVVVDLMPTVGSPGVELGPEAAHKLITEWCVSGKPGAVDSRPIMMEQLRPDLDRILHHGGVFIIFAKPKTSVAVHEVGGGMMSTPRLTTDTWRMLTVLGDVRVEEDSGQSIEVERHIAASEWGHALVPYLSSAYFRCTLSVFVSVTESKRWLPLASSKYGDVVAAVILPRTKDVADANRIGAVYLLPQMTADQKGDLLIAMLHDVLPQMHPWLFPYAEELQWVHQRSYEIPRVIELTEEIAEVRSRTDEEVARLKTAIQEEQTRMSHLQGLLTETGSDLVKSVKQTLEMMDFTQVIDGDAELEASDSDAPKREDLQIHDNSPVLLVEVKGIAGIPTDEDALAVRKYFAPRMKEWNRTDISGVTMINHQRHIPPLQRNNAGCYRDDLVVTAEQDDIGLWTTWDLYRLARSYIENNWQPSSVVDLFYRVGRVEPVPTHYSLIGAVEGRWPQAEAISVVLQVQGLAVGDRIAFGLPVVFKEQEITSLQIDDTSVDHVDPGTEVGIKVLISMAEIAKGTRVYIVDPDKQ